jgi:hypothetical protein
MADDGNSRRSERLDQVCPPGRIFCLSLDNPSESQPSKRFKSSRAKFYDSLSKVWLTRRALKELDRRTRQANSPQRPAPPSQRKETSQEETSKQKRFARHGGPDLRDLRGVRLNCQSVHVISDQSFSIQLQLTSSLHARWPPAAPPEAGTPNLQLQRVHPRRLEDLLPTIKISSNTTSTIGFTPRDMNIVMAATLRNQDWKASTKDCHNRDHHFHRRASLRTFGTSNGKTTG